LLLTAALSARGTRCARRAKPPNAQALVLVEQNLDAIEYLGDTDYVIDKGAIAVSGRIAELERDAHVDHSLRV